QELRERVGVGHQPDVALQAVGVFAQLAAHALSLLQQQACVMDEGAAGRCRLHALPIAVQQRGAELDLHVADSRARRGHRQVHAIGAGGDAAGLYDVQEEFEIGQVEAHGGAVYCGRRNGTNITGETFLIVISPAATFSISCSCWTLKRGPTGRISRPPRRSWSISGWGTCSGAAVTTMMSKGACSGQPA